MSPWDSTTVYLSPGIKVNYLKVVFFLWKTDQGSNRRSCADLCSLHLPAARIWISHCGGRNMSRKRRKNKSQ